jgi:hypothetical protein
LALPPMLLLPFIALLIVPLIRPFRWERLLWTYLIPVIPFVLMFDGMVSCLRSYTPDELRAFADELPEYEWRVGWLWSPMSPLGVTYMVGWPRSTA